MNVIDNVSSMWQRMPAGDRRAIAMGGAVLLPAFLYLAVIRPFHTAVGELRERSALEQRSLQREEGLLAVAGTLPRLVDEASNRAKRADMRLVRGENPALEEAQLTRYLEQTASFSRVLLQEARGIEPPRGTDTTGVIRPVRLAVRGESDLKGVLTYVQRIEASPLLLRIAELSMEPVTEKATADAQQGVIKFAFVLEAYAPSARAARADMQEVVR